MEDAEIVKLFFARAETAITALREKYGARALRVGCDITGSEQDAEECVSDACLALWQSIPPTKPLYLGAYFIAAVRNHALMRVRAGQAQRRGGKSYDAAFDELGELLVDPNTPERQLEARELAAAIDGFLSTLSRDDRVIFMRRYWLASPLGEIARDFGCSTARVKSSLHRSRKKLKQRLEEEGLL